MWYFTWILGLAAAALFAVVNATWLEIQEDNTLHEQLRGKDVTRSKPDAND